MLRCYSPFFLVVVLILSSCSRVPSSGEREIVRRENPRVLPPKIVIDAGHGGKDLGAQSTSTPKSQEKAFNLVTAKMLNRYLQQMGYQTIMTRGDDLFIPLDLRAAFANGNEAALFVSVHYNSAPSTKAEGVEVYYYESDDDKGRTEKSKHLAKGVLDQIIEGTECKSRGVKHGNFAVIRETKMPAILVEGGFMTNESELAKLRDPEYLKKIAMAIAKGVHQYIQKG